MSVDTIKKPPVKAGGPLPEDGCWNCQYGDTRIGATFVACGVALPPQVTLSADPRRHMAGKQYICIFHKLKKNK